MVWSTWSHICLAGGLSCCPGSVPCLLQSVLCTKTSSLPSLTAYCQPAYSSFERPPRCLETFFLTLSNCQYFDFRAASGPVSQELNRNCLGHLHDFFCKWILCNFSFMLLLLSDVYSCLLYQQINFFWVWLTFFFKHHSHSKFDFRSCLQRLTPT